jgi:hypothetical protein
MGQFQNDLQLYKSLEPAARPIDTYAPIRLPSAGPQLNELAEGLSVFNRGLRKFAVEERAEFQEEERKAGETFANQLTEADRIEIARQGIRDAEKAGLIPKGASPTRLIAIQEAIGRELARDYEKRAFEQVARLSDPTNVEDIDEAFREEWSKTNLGNSFYITAAAVEEQTKIDNRLVRQVHAQRAANTLDLNKEQHTNELEYQLDVAGTRGEVYSTEKIEAWMNEGFKQFGSSFYEEGWRAIQQEALSLAQDGKADEAIALVNSFKNANPTKQKNAGMDRRFSNEIDLFEDDIRKAEDRFEAQELAEQEQQRSASRNADIDAARKAAKIISGVAFNLKDDRPSFTEFREASITALTEAGVANEVIGAALGDITNAFNTLENPQEAAERRLLLVQGNPSVAELEARGEELGAPATEIEAAREVIDSKERVMRAEAFRQVKGVEDRWEDALSLSVADLDDTQFRQSDEIKTEQRNRFKEELEATIKRVRKNNPGLRSDEIAALVEDEMDQWVTSNLDSVLNPDNVNSSITKARQVTFVMPSVSQLPAAPPSDEFTEEGALFGAIGGRLANRVGDYFEETTAQGRERYARENVQPVIQEELKAADFQIRKITRGFTRPATSLTPATPVPGRELDQNGIDARRYRSAVLFTGVSIEDLERGTFKNGVTIVDDLREPRITPYFPNKKALSDALDEYDNADPEAQSGTLIGRLITELGGNKTGTADQFATMQGLLLQRRGMN